MKIDRLSERVETSGEVLFGPETAGTLTTYMIYGRLGARETGRRLKPGPGARGNPVCGERAGAFGNSRLRRSGLRRRYGYLIA